MSTAPPGDSPELLHALSLGKHCSTVLVLLISADLYVLFTVQSATGAALALYTGSTALPLLGANVPTWLFCYAAPFLLCSLHTLFQCEVARLRRILREMGSGGVAAIVRIDSILVQRLLAEADSGAPAPLLDRWARVSRASVPLLTPVTLFVFWSRMAAARTPATAIYLACTILVATSTLGLKRGIRAAPLRSWGGLFCASVPLLYSLATVRRSEERSASWWRPVFAPTIARGIDLHNSDLGERDLSGVDLTAANLRHSYLSGAVVDFANLSRVELDGAVLRDASLRNANLRGASLRAADLAGVRAEGAHFDDACLSDARLVGATLAGAVLARADLSGADLFNANFTGADLQYSKFKGANLVGAVMTGAILIGARLEGARLSGRQLTKAKLNDASLAGANLALARLGGAELRGADLTHADLTGADFESADLTGAVMEGATMDDADFRAADGLTQAQIDRAHCGSPLVSRPIEPRPCH